MNWFLIALISPIANAFVNHFDKYLISRFIKGGAVGALILFSSLFAVVLLPVLWFLEPGIITGISHANALILLVTGCLLTLAILFYLYALEYEETSIVMPLAQLVPVFGLVLGYFILGELISGRELWAAAFIVTGGMIVALELNGRQTRFKYRMMMFMVMATFLYALSAVIFKYVAVDQGFMSSLFWAMAGKVVLGLIIFFAIKKYRDQFLNLLRSNRHTIIGLNVINEIIGLIAEVALVFAVLLAPVVLVQAVSGLQPMFVFIFGILLTIFFPAFAKESLVRKHVIQKIAGIVIVTIGVSLLDLST